MTQIEGTTFDKIIIGRRFKTVTDVIYRKLSRVSAIPVVDTKGIAVENGKRTSLFYKSNVLLFEVV